jgi:hypothetical protein
MNDLKTKVAIKNSAIVWGWIQQIIKTGLSPEEVHK